MGTVVELALGQLRPGRQNRRTWAGNGRLHIEVRGADRLTDEGFRHDIEDALAAVDGVRWAALNGALGRVVVAVDEGRADTARLLGVIESVETRHAAGGERFPMGRPEHPADVEPLRRAGLTLGADTVGLAAGVFGQVVRLTRLPVELASVVSFAEQQPRVREVLEQAVGAPATDLGLGMASAVAQAVAQGPFGLAVDASQRFHQVFEIAARRQAWARLEPALFGEGTSAAPPLPAVGRRPVRLPDGPIERAANRTAVSSAAAAALALPFTRSPRRAAGLLVAGLPKASRMGREIFAATLDRELSRRDVLVMDQAALRRLDRVDAVVIEAPAVLAEPMLDGALEPLAGAVAEAVREAGLELVLAGGPRWLADRLDAGRRMAGGSQLCATVRSLQREGRGVLLVGTTQSTAMLAADLSIGIRGDGAPVPWSADLVTPAGLADAHLVVEAAAAARRVSTDSAWLALAGTGIGGVWSVMGPPFGAGRRATSPVNAAALTAQVGALLAVRALVRRGRHEPTAPERWHEMDRQTVLDALGTPPGGLDPAQVRQRRAVPARQPSPPERLWRALGAELANPLTPVLGLGAGLAAGVGSMTDAGLVAGVVGANALIGAVQRLRAEISIERLMEVAKAPTLVRRSDGRRPVSPEDLVVGDLVELGPGDVVPADCRVVESDCCEVDESVLTGESLPVIKEPAATPGAAVADRRCMLYEGTTVSSGWVLGVVVAVGAATEVGRSLADAPEPPPSGVEQRLSSLTARTLPVTLASGAAVTGIGLLRSGSTRRAVASGVSLMVAAVPEGLPLLASAAQQSAARRLSSRGALVRNPRTIEALGRVDTLCFDKTGTLTMGQIRLQWVSDGEVDERIGDLGAQSRAVLAAALRASPDMNGAAITDLPHATDRAVVAGAGTAGVTAADGLGGWETLGELAFDPSRGFHATVGAGPDGAHVTVKGAPEVVLPRCTAWRGPDGTVRLGDDTVHHLDRVVERMAGRGLRVLAVAERRSSDNDDVPDARVSNMELLGFLGLADAVRPTAAAAVSGLRDAGIEVVMITGDHPSTARAIGEDLGLVNGHRVVAASELDELSDEELDELLPAVSVFARVTPAHKVRIVRAYQRLGRVVAMTGDGANDAPAIRLADAGIALGGERSAAAREAADLVVVDDQIETILTAIAEGRSMWMSVRDAIAILIGGNLGEVGFSVVATALAGTSPLGARQFLLVNLLTDMLPAMTIAVRPPADRSADLLLHEGPDASLGGSLTRQIALRAAGTATGALGAWLVARVTGTRGHASTVALVALVGTQLAQTAVVGGRSPLVLASSVASGAALAAIVQTPGVSHFFGCRPLGPLGWSTAVVAASAATAGTALVSWAGNRGAAAASPPAPSIGEASTFAPPERPSGAAHAVAGNGVPSRQALEWSSPGAPDGDDPRDQASRSPEVT